MKTPTLTSTTPLLSTSLSSSLTLESSHPLLSAMNSLNSIYSPPHLHIFLVFVLFVDELVCIPGTTGYREAYELYRATYEDLNNYSPELNLFSV